MKKIFVLIFLFSVEVLSAQQAFHNFGNIKMHADSEVGFHTHLINDGVFDDNLGSAGFYGYDLLNVSGLNRVIFNNLEIDVYDGLHLYTSLGVLNECQFTRGRVFTPRQNIDISLDFIDYEDHFGESNDEHVDGYVTYIGDRDLVFPIGDENYLRPMELPSQDDLEFFRGAYFKENPNNEENSFGTVFSTVSKEFLLESVNHWEFWDLDGEAETVVTLTWDDQSRLDNLTDDFNSLVVVGWDANAEKWRNLGNTYIEGDFLNGKLTSAAFVPDEYTILTIGSSISEGSFEVYNAISPNGDNTNEKLIFEGLEQYDNNTLKIYNRWGNLVYEKMNYDNSWNARANVSNVVSEGKILPGGTYFYILEINDGSVIASGWVFVAY